MRLFGFLLFAALALPQSNWQSLLSPGGANVKNTFKITDSIFIAGDSDGSIYRTTDQAKSWEKVLLTGAIGMGDIIFNSKGDILLGTNKLFLSSDQGLTWTIKSPMGGRHIAMDSSGFILQSDGNDLRYSSDNGNSWNDFVRPWPYKSMMEISTNGSSFFLIFEDSIYCSIDSCRSWSKYTSGLPDYFYNVLFLNKSEALAATSRGIMYSSDSARSWVYRNNGLGYNNLRINRIYKSGATIYACSELGLYFSNDLGLNWSHSNNFQIKKWITSMIKSDDKLFVSTELGFFRLYADKFENRFYGVYSIKPNSIITGDHNELLYSTPLGFYLSTDVGDTWNLMSNFWEGVNSFSSQDSSYVVQGKDDYFYWSSDMGSTWSKRGYLDRDGFVLFSKIHKNRFYFNGVRYITGLPPALNFYYSTDEGRTLINYGPGVARYFTIIPGDTLLCDLSLNFWTSLGIHYSVGVQSFRSLTTGISGLLTAFGYDNNRRVYAATDAGLFRLNRPQSKWELFDPSMVSLSNMFFDKFNYFYAIKGGKLYVSVPGRKWYDITPTSDVGKMFQVVTDSSGYFYLLTKEGKILKSSIPSAITTLPNPPALAYPINMQSVTSFDTVKFKWAYSEPLAFKYMLMLSADSLFTTFDEFQVQDTTFTVTSLTGNKNYYWKVKAYNSYGWSSFSNVFRFSTFPTSVTDNTVYYNYNLAQNYPNPFNPSTNISFEIAKPGNVKLAVYDILGREVAILINEYRKEGRYSIDYNASSLSSGVYIYRIISGLYNSEHKMMILR